MTFSMCKRIIILLIVALARCNAVTPKWEYTGKNHGPMKWSDDDPACASFRQSPVALSTSGAEYDETLKAVKIYRKTTPTSGVLTLTNNARTASIAVADNSYYVSLNGTKSEQYAIYEVNFHWGSNNSLGSEHTLSGKPLALEAQLLAYSKLYKTLNGAQNAEEGLAAISVLFKVDDTVNDAIHKQLNTSITNVKTATTSSALSNMNLLDLFSKANYIKYFRYAGSLTYPPCSENVIWTVLAEPIPVPSYLLKSLRLMVETGSTTIENNFRPTQDLNSDTSPIKRTVHKSWGASSSTQHHLLYSILAFITALVWINMTP